MTDISFQEKRGSFFYSLRNRLSIQLVASIGVIAIVSIIVGYFSLRDNEISRIQGNQLLDHNGRPFKMIGVSLSGLEYSCQGVGDYSSDSYLSMRSWHVNTVRIPISSALWFDTTPSCRNYQRLVKTAIKNAEATGLYVIIDIHSSLRGHDELPDSTVMKFWQDFLPSYKNDNMLLVEVFNEPHDVDWSIWKSGGIVHDSAGDYEAVGMQTLIDKVNEIAPTIPVIVSGLSWQYDFSGIRKGYSLTGRNLIYGVHLYNFAGKQPDNWEQSFGFLKNQAPILITEFGDTTHCDGKWLQEIMPSAHEQFAGMIGWAWTLSNDYCHYPSLIQDWKGTPSPYGQAIYDFFKGL
jgi:endoglucanase